MQMALLSKGKKYRTKGIFLTLIPSAKTDQESSFIPRNIFFLNVDGDGLGTLGGVPMAPKKVGQTQN